ncbi:ATP synthase F1 subunit epsilon [candidate division KSB1 bacterium]|nr:ATP synthase F1 subunit epsilon [candidate division KSB1 bacterium]
MAKNFHLDVITPTEKVFSGDVWHLRAPGAGGDFGVLADHAPMMAGLKPGRLRIDLPDMSFDLFAIGRGYFEVHGNNAVVLAGGCLRKDDIDLDRAQAAQERALQHLAKSTDPREVEEARAALEFALAQIKVAEG